MSGSLELSQQGQRRNLGIADCSFSKATSSTSAVRRLCFFPETEELEALKCEADARSPVQSLCFSPLQTEEGSPHTSPPQSPTRLPTFVRPNREALKRMTQSVSQGAAGRAIRAKSYWESRFEPLRRLEEASSLLRHGVAHARLIAEKVRVGLQDVPTTVSEASQAHLKNVGKSRESLTHSRTLSEMAVCEVAGSGPQAECDDNQGPTEIWQEHNLEAKEDL